MAKQTDVQEKQDGQMDGHFFAGLLLGNMLSDYKQFIQVYGG